MSVRTPQSEPANEEIRPKWFNSPVRFYKGNLTEIRECVPRFERRSFGLMQPDNGSSRLNERLDTIVRLPFCDDQTFVPVGVVSKDYSLVQHHDVLDLAAAALEGEKISPDNVMAELTLTNYGERMALSLYLPKCFNFDPGDGCPMALRLECFNSVDGSSRFRVLIGWFRFVCSNGLIVGLTRCGMRRRHVGDFKLSDVAMVLRAGLDEADTERKNFQRWRKSEIKPDRLVHWVNNDLRAGWGFKAAARTFHIARTGKDAEIVGQYKGNTPTSIFMRETNRVAGAPQRCNNLFDVSQILAWLAKERRDVQEQLDWREQIPDLIAPLVT